MSIDDAPPNGEASTRPMWEALAAELRREGDDGDGRKAGNTEPILLARSSCS